MDAGKQLLRDQIFEAALEMPVGEQHEYVRKASAGDVEVEGDVIRLLGVYGQMDSEFLEGAAGSEPAPQPEAGQRTGKYELLELISQGGMGALYRARHSATGRNVALKFINIPGADLQEVQSRFFMEVQALRSAQHENVVEIYEVGDYAGAPYLVMELLAGEDLAKAIRSRRTGDIEKKLSIAMQIARALEHIHGAGILHRDVKPSNVFLEPSGRIKLLDFGVARLLEGGRTHASTFAGTIQYMAPEQLKGGPATRLTDIYSFGILLYELFAGVSPAAGKSIAAILDGTVASSLDVQRLRTAGTPAAVVDLILRATNGDPMHRPQSFDFIQDRLSSAAIAHDIGGPVQRVRQRLSKSVLAGAGLFGAAAALAILLTQAGDARRQRTQAPEPPDAPERMRQFRDLQRLVDSRNPGDLRVFAADSRFPDVAAKANGAADELERLQASEAITIVLTKVADAYRNKSIAALRVVYPALSGREEGEIQFMFRHSRTTLFRPEEVPRLLSPELAIVRCRRKSMQGKEEIIEVRLRRRDQAWQIEAMIPDQKPGR